MRRLVLGTTTFLLAACGSDSMVGPSEILATTWRLQSIERAGAAVVTVPTPDRYTLRLDANGQAGVRADCNSCGGRYTLDGDALDLSPLACTLIACAADSLDGPFLTILGSGARVRVDGDVLFVSSTKGTLRFTR